MTRRSAVAVASLAMVVALAGCGNGPSSPDAASAEWTAPVTVVREPVPSLGAPRIAAGGREVAVTWEWAASTGGLQVVRLGTDGRWSAPERVPSLNPGSAQIGADALGRVVLAWTAALPDDVRFRCAWAATATASGAWSTPRTFGCGAGDVRLSVAASGHALLAWSWPSNGLGAASYDPVLGWLESQGLTDGERTPQSFSAAVDDEGLGAVTWYEASAGGAGEIHLTFLRGGILYATTLREELSFPRDPRVAFESAGNAVLAWAGGYEGGIEAASLSTNGGVVAGVTNDVNDTCADVGGSGRGMALLSWSRRGAAPGVFAATHVLGSLWAPEDLQRAPPLPPLCPVLEMDAQGNAVAAWTAGGSAGMTAEVWASVRPAATGRWTAPRRLATQAVEPAVAIAGGVAYVVWVTESGELIQESRLRFAP